MQGHAALAVELGAAHFRTTETTGNLNADALGASLHRALHALAHRASEGHAARELLGDALGNELGLDFGVLHFEDVELHLLAGELFKIPTDAIGLSATAADDDAGASSVDINTNAITRALDLYLGNTRALHTIGEQAADLDVFLNVIAIALTRLGAIGEPP